MGMKVGRRPGGGGESMGLAERAVVIGCDQPFCEKGLTFPVNLQSTDSQCIRDAKRFFSENNRGPQVSGWYIDTSVDPAKFFCSRHADIRRLGTVILGGRNE